MNRISNNNNIRYRYESIQRSAAEMEKHVMAFQETPLTALSKKSLQQLSVLLNATTNSRSENGYERDWRGLASLSKQRHVCYENISGNDPTGTVIQLWCANSPKTATFAKLQLFLGILERCDVADDILENLLEDTKAYQKNVQLHNEKITDTEVNFNSSFDAADDPNLLTTSDVIRAQQGLPFQMYDAFILYADSDINNVAEIMIHIEDNPKYYLNLCMKNRDLLRGVEYNYLKLKQLIERCCKNLIVVLTAEFLKSREYKFLIRYTGTLQLQSRTSRIITLLYEESVAVPTFLETYTHLRYRPASESPFEFYSKLANAIQSDNTTAQITTPSTSHYTKIIDKYSTLNRATNHVLKQQVSSAATPSSNIPAKSSNTKKHRKWLKYILPKVFRSSKS